jgi:hypothetical protein
LGFLFKTILAAIFLFVIIKYYLFVHILMSKKVGATTASKPAPPVKQQPKVA